MPSPLPRSPWFSCPKPDAAVPVRLWCFPFAGGGTTPWYPYAQKFAGLAELVAVRPPGRENRYAEPPLATAGALVAAVTQAVAPHVRASDVFLGHSLGALVAFEVARSLHARGATRPRALIVGGSRAPDFPRREADLSHLDDDAFLNEVDVRYGGLPPQVRTDPELRELALPVLRGDMAAYESYNYVPSAPLEIPILAINSDADPTVNGEEITGWANHTAAPFRAEIVPGGHMFVLTHVDAVATVVRNVLAPSYNPRGLAGVRT
jgi:surfactin synthase thioesterase subunit